MEPTMTRRAARWEGRAASTPPNSRGSLSESGHRRLTLLAVCVAAFMIQIDVTIVNVALPQIQADLHASPGGLEWVISAYALALAALIPAGGALGDRYGRKRVFLAGMVVFTFGTIGCALSASAVVLIVARVVQGVGGAAMLALSLSIVTDTFTGATRAGAIGGWAAIGGIGFGLGPVAGGVLLSWFGWASVFWVNVPLAVIGLLLTASAVRETRNPQPRRLDGPGLALSCAGLLAITFGLIESASQPWISWSVATPLAAGAILLLGFAIWQRHTPNPMAPPALLRARGFLSACMIYLVSYTACAGVLFYVTLLYQNIEGWSALRTGLSWLLMNVPFLAAAQLAGRLDRRFTSAAVIAIACLVGATGVFALSFAGPSTPFAVTAVGYLVSGLGFGTLVPAVTHVAMRDVPPEASGAASGIVNASRQIGTSIGLAVLGTIGASAAISNWSAKTSHFSPSARSSALAQTQNVAGARTGAIARALGASYQQPAAESFAHGYHVAVLVGAACLLAAALVAILGLRPHPPLAQPQTQAPVGATKARE